MNTQGQTNYKKGALFEVNIDFDEASEAWRANKKYIGNGTYKYIKTTNITTPNNAQKNNISRRCNKQTHSGSQCKRETKDDYEFCFQHLQSK